MSKSTSQINTKEHKSSIKRKKPHGVFNRKEVKMTQKLTGKKVKTKTKNSGSDIQTGLTTSTTLL